MMTKRSLRNSTFLALALLAFSSAVIAADAVPAIIAKDGIAFSRTDNGSIVPMTRLKRMTIIRPWQPTVRVIK